jgi:hypothetical protein
MAGGAEMWRYTDPKHTTVTRELPEGGAQFRPAEGIDLTTILPELPAPPTRVSVSPWQIRKALNISGLRDAVEAAIAAADVTTKDAWEYATEFERDHSLVVSLGGAMGKTVEEMDALFELAKTL